MGIKIIRISFISFLIFLFTLAPVSPSKIFQEYLNVNADEDEEEIISEYTEWTSDREINGYVTINENATLVIKKGITITFKEGANLIVEGKLFVKGTKTEPVKIRMDGVDEISFDDLETIEYYGYQIRIFGEANFRNADISGGGNLYQLYLKNNFVNRAYAMDSEGVILSENGKLEMNSCHLHDNIGGVQLRETDGEKVTVNKTIFEDNFSFDARNDYEGGKYPDFMYNWWRGPNGPEIVDEKYKIYKYINDEINFSNWLTSKNYQKDPVIIIPGIMGSAPWYEGVAGHLVLDPMLHTYDNLVASFKKNGYTEDVDLFEFPYEWRDSNILTADLLKQKIQEVKKETSWPKVDLVAHSMGGLVARYYIEGDDYQDDVDQLVTLGTPHRGSPKSYPRWEAAEGFFEADEIVGKKLFQVEAFHAGYLDLKEYIRKEVISVKELLPDYDYLEKVSDGKMKTYPDDYPDNTFLDFLNNEERIENLDNVSFINIIGNFDSKETIKQFRVTKSTKENKWEHGMPENFYNDSTDRGIEYGKGDGTVPLSSAKGIKSDEEKEINSLHMDLPTKAQCYAIKELTGKDSCKYVSTVKRVVDVLTFGVFSPIDIQVIAPDGKRVGKNSETGKIVNEIENAYYSGSDAKNEFLVIPNPEDGEYKIIAEGTGNGDYKIEVTKIIEGETEESTKEIIGTASEGKQEEKIITIEDGEIADTVSPTVAGSKTDSDDEDEDEEDDESKKDEKKNKKDSSFALENHLSENNNIFENISNDVPEENYDGKAFSESNADFSSNSEGLYEHKEENKKFTKVIMFVFTIVVILSIIFVIFRRRIDLKS